MNDLKENINNSENNTNNGFNFIDFLRVILNYKKVLIISTLIIGLITTFLMYFVVEPIYLSNATVKSAGSGLGIGGLLGMSAIPDLGGLEELSGAPSTKELALYEEILSSRRCIEETIIKFNLLEVYNIKFMQDAVKGFRENIMTISSNKKAGTLTIGIYDTDKQRAKEIADFLIFQLNKIFAEMSALNAKNNKEFIEQRYDSAKKDLKISEDSLRDFQNKFGISPEIQVEVASRTSLGLETTIKSEELKLELLKKMLTADQPEIKEQEEKILILNKQLSDINNSTDGVSSLQLKGLPNVVMNFYRLKRDVEIQNKILSTLIPIYEQAKFEQQRETPTVIVLDNPNLPERKAKPKRIVTIFLSMVAFFVFFSIVIVFYELYYKKLMVNLRNE